MTENEYETKCPKCGFEGGLEKDVVVMRLGNPAYYRYEVKIHCKACGWRLTI